MDFTTINNFSLMADDDNYINTDTNNDIDNIDTNKTSNQIRGEYNPNVKIPPKLQKEIDKGLKARVQCQICDEEYSLAELNIYSYRSCLNREYRKDYKCLNVPSRAEAQRQANIDRRVAILREIDDSQADRLEYDLTDWFYKCPKCNLIRPQGNFKFTKVPTEE